LAFPTGDARFVHLDPVPQTELARFYAEADAFVLASRQDGFGVVLAQALASGLPIICTDRTGGADLAHTLALAERITIIPHDDLSALIAAIAGLCNRCKSGERLLPLADSDRATLSWAAYGRRYAAEIATYFGQCGRASFPA
jgi:glycosyltransferase involved in cell wall biosynthesis